MRDRLSDYQEAYGDLYNLEASPAESTSFRMAKHDVKRFKDIKTAAKPGGTPYYTNSSHLPVGFTSDIFDALEIQDGLQTLYTSGTVFHAFLGEKLPDWRAAASLVRKIAENFTLPYYTLSPTYSVCAGHGYLAGEQILCPECGKATEVYSRITGYYRPVENWNDGKAQEYKDRILYDPENSVLKNKTGCREEDCPPAAEKRLLLFATKTCPKCRIVISELEKNGIGFEKLYVEDNREKAKEYGLSQAPALVVVDGGKAEKYLDVAEIKGFIEIEKGELRKEN